MSERQRKQFAKAMVRSIVGCDCENHTILRTHTNLVQGPYENTLFTITQ